MSEHDTQNAIIDLITLRGGIAIRVNSGLTLIKNPDGSTRAIKHAARGTADIISLYRGWFISIEVKHGKAKPTPEQIEFQNKVHKAGGIGIIAWDIETVNDLLTKIDDGVK